MWSEAVVNTPSVKFFQGAIYQSILYISLIQKSDLCISCTKRHQSLTLGFMLFNTGERSESVDEVKNTCEERLGSEYLSKTQWTELFY